MVICEQYKLNVHRLILAVAIITVLCISPSFADNNRSGSAIVSGQGLLYTQSAHTYGKARYAFGVQELSMQREYFVVENTGLRIPKDNTSVFGVPITVGLTDFIDLSVGFYFFHNARPYKNKFDVYDYHSSPESGIGSSCLGLKVRLPLKKENRFQIAAKLSATFNSSQSQIDGMNYRWTRIENDFEALLLETIDITSFMSLHLEQGYVFSGSDIYDDQLVLAGGLDVHPFDKWSFGLELFNLTFMGVSPQSVIKSVYYPFNYWDGYTHLGNPAYIKDDDLDFYNDFFVAVPSISYRVNDLITLNAGVAINIADQKGGRWSASL